MVNATSFAAVALLAAVVAPLSKLFSERLAEPYMDEIFHIPQAHRYCVQDWTWDPKITTFPGIYIVSVAASWTLSAAQSLVSHDVEQWCLDNSYLRGVNAFLAVTCFLVFENVSRALHPKDSGKTTSVRALACTLFPLHFFFGFMFYTDVGAIFWIFSTYAASLLRRRTLSALCGVLAVLHRQTNVVWIAFIIFDDFLRLMTQEGAVKRSTSIWRTIVSVLTKLIQSPSYLSHIFPLGLILLGFVGFVFWNGAIVVGDHSNHSMTLHLVQPLYFLGFTLMFLAPVLLFSLLQAKPSLRLVRHLVAGAALSVAAAFVVKHWTIAHPFLLADNRHYPFYVWKKILNRTWWTRYAAVPVYTIGAFVINLCLSRKCSSTWILGFVACTSIALIPTPLIEFRYFTVPFLFCLLHVPSSSLPLLLNTILFGAVNAVTMWVFLEYTFVVDGATARFMW